MNREEYERMFQLEDSYWWFVGRHDLVLSFMEAQYGAKNDLSILDIGCGTGAMSRKLERFGRVVSADFSPLALNFSRQRGLCRLCAADAMRLPFRDASFDVVVALDTLEHLPDDHAAIAEFKRVLKPGGRVISTVPANPALWSGHDVALMHHRRYLAEGLRERFTEAGFRVQRLSHAMTFLYPIVWLVRRLFYRETDQPKASLIRVPGVVNSLLIALLAAENKLIHFMKLPFGVTIFCMAEKPCASGD